MNNLLPTYVTQRNCEPALTRNPELAYLFTKEEAEQQLAVYASRLSVRLELEESKSTSASGTYMLRVNYALAFTAESLAALLQPIVNGYGLTVNMSDLVGSTRYDIICKRILTSLQERLDEPDVDTTFSGKLIDSTETEAQFMDKVSLALNALSAAYKAGTENTGGGCMCIRIALTNDYWSHWGIADVTWGADVYKGDEFQGDADDNFQPLGTTISSDETDPAKVADAIHEAIIKWNEGRAA